MAGHIRIDVHVGAGEPDQGTERRVLFLVGLGNRLGEAGLELVRQLGAALAHIENLGELLNALVDALDAERRQARTVSAHQVVLGFTV